MTEEQAVTIIKLLVDFKVTGYVVLFMLGGILASTFRSSLK